MELMMQTAEQTAAHTPGPWSVSLADNPKHGSSWGGYWQIDAQYDAVACNQFCYAGHRNEKVSQANARLIAAAPELLAALHTARDYVADAASGGLTYEGSGEGFIAMAKEDLARIDAAIAKAEGR